VLESKIADPSLHFGIRFSRHNTEDDIKVICRASWRKVRIIQEQVYNGSADEGVAESHTIETVGHRSKCSEVGRRHGY